MKILVAIPSYRCANQIGRVLSEFDNELLQLVDEIAIFDNRSPDDTLNAACTAAQNLNSTIKKDALVKVFENNQNYGLGGTHKTAFLYAEANGFDYVAILHGDNQAYSPELKNLILTAKANPDVDAVLGARFMPGSRRLGYSTIRTWGNFALNALYTVVSGRLTFDLGSGLNLFKVSPLKDHNFLRFSNAFTFNMDLLLDYYRKRSQLKYVPITWREEDQVSNAKALNVGWITLKILFKWRLGRNNKGQPQSNAIDYLTTKVH